MMSKRIYFDIQNRIFGDDPGIVLPHWNKRDESVVVLSPHDDDALLGAGYMIDALLNMDVPVTVVIFCRGDAGYSEASLRDSIVDIRKTETQNAYMKLGLTAGNVILLDKPDFGLRRHVAWDGLGKENGLFGEMIRLLRQRSATRLFIANGYKEHSDHTAVYDVGMFDGIQSSDPILADFGKPTRLQSTHVFSVWADFSPEDALISGRETDLRANMGIAVDDDVEERIIEGLRCYVSQGKIIDGLIRMREEKRSDKGFIELYQLMDPRPKLPYAPYVDWVNRLSVADHYRNQGNALK